MHITSTDFSLTAILRKTCMIIGLLLFVTLGTLSLAGAQDQSAVRGTANTHPGLKSAIVFSR